MTVPSHVLWDSQTVDIAQSVTNIPFEILELLNGVYLGETNKNSDFFNPGFQFPMKNLNDTLKSSRLKSLVPNIILIQVTILKVLPSELQYEDDA